MGLLTKNKPKCLLEFQGRTLLETQLGVINEFNVKKIIVVKGYLRDLLNIQGIKYYINYEGHNMVYSLFCAENELNGDVIISYGDIIFEKRILSKLLSTTHDISVIIDLKWEKYFRARFGNPYSEGESLMYDSNYKIIEIGDSNPLPEKVQGQYIGLIKLTKKGCEIVKEVYYSAKSTFHEKHWIRSRKVEDIYMTDLLQALINSGYSIYGVPIESGWLEFDSESDYRLYKKWEKEGKLNYYYKTK